MPIGRLDDSSFETARQCAIVRVRTFKNLLTSYQFSEMIRMYSHALGLLDNSTNNCSLETWFGSNVIPKSRCLLYLIHKE